MIPKVRGVSPELDQVQSRLAEGINRAIPDWLNNGRQLTVRDEKGRESDEVELAPGLTSVKHGLGRIPIGWVFLRFRTGAALTAPVTEFSANKISLIFTNPNAAAVKVKLWVY